MKLILDTKQLALAVGTASKLLEKFTAVTVLAKKEEIEVKIATPDCYYSVVLPAKVEKKGQFSILPELLMSILKTRSQELEFVVKDNRLTFRAVAARLQGKDISLLGDEDIRAPASSDKKQLKLPKKMQRRILSLLDVCALQSFYGKVLAQTLYAKNGITTVICADHACVAIGTITSGEKVNIANIDLPAEYSEKLKYIPGDDFCFSFTNDLMIVDTTYAHVELKMLQTDQISSVEKVLALEKSKVTCSFDVDCSKIKSEVDGLIISFEKGVPLSVQLKNKTLQFDYKTSSGTFSSSMNVTEVSGQCQFLVDAEIFRNLLNKTSGKITVKVRDATIALCFEVEKTIEARFIIAKMNGKSSNQSSKD